MKTIFSIIILSVILGSCSTLENKSPVFFLQTSPGKKPHVFAPGFVSDSLSNRDLVISPDGNELYFSGQLRHHAGSVIFFSRFTNGKWSKPEVARFCAAGYNDLEPAFTPDGQTLFFASNRPNEQDSLNGYDLWFVTRSDTSWSLPRNLGAPVNSPANEFFPSIASNGSIYFTRKVEDMGEDILFSKRTSDGYSEPVSLPATVNTTGDEFNAYIAPDESFILFTGYRREENIGIGDLYISWKTDEGEWGVATNLGTSINQDSSLSYCPFVSADRKLLFFASNRRTSADLPNDDTKILNGKDNIFWVNAESYLKANP